MAAFPNANSPQLLTRTLETLARGVRSTRGLQEALNVNQRTVQYYLNAAVWLEMMSQEPRMHLTPLGLEYVYGGRDRPAIYAKAVQTHPFVAELLRHSGNKLPSSGAVGALIQTQAPELAETTVKRRASAVRSLIAPAMVRVMTAEQPQLGLPLAHSRRTPAPTRINRDAGRHFNPDVYRHILLELLAHGELAMSHLRSLLDRMGSEDIPIGGYIELLQGRGDAVRIGERMVATAQAIRRRSIASSTASVILSDPGYRAYLELAADNPDDTRLETPEFRRYKIWTRRLLGNVPSPRDLAKEVQSMLDDRSLRSFPVALSDNATPPATTQGSFIELWAEEGLLISLPPWLELLENGLSEVNRRLRIARQLSGAVSRPDVGYRPIAAHGGIICPGEPLPKALPDTRTLRMRLLRLSPYPSMIAALLLLHRFQPSVTALRFHQGQWTLQRHRKVAGELLETLDEYATARGWHPSRRPEGSYGASALLRTLESLGVVTRLPTLAVLDDGFFDMLRSDPEEMEISEELEPLAADIGAWLDRRESGN